MSDTVQLCARSAPPIHPDIHRRIRLRRLGLHGAVARTVADLAFGEPRDAVVLVAIAAAATQAEGGRR